MKACPDCAELVLEAARKCRYCGYRFDRPPSQAPQEGLFAHLFRRPAPHLTMTETLQQLGVELRPGRAARRAVARPGHGRRRLRGAHR